MRKNLKKNWEKKLLTISVCILGMTITACGSVGGGMSNLQNGIQTKYVGNEEKTENDDKNAGETTDEELPGEDITSEDEISSITEETTQTSTEQTTTQVPTTTVPETTTQAPTTTVPETTTQAPTTTVPETTTAMIIKELNKTMYVKSSVNVRKGHSTDYEKIGNLKKGQEVKVTGQSEQTGWYRIEYNGGVGFVSDGYLQNEQVTEPTTTAPKETSLEKNINAQVLNPVTTEFEPLKQSLDDVFSKIFTDGMTTYQKVKACYDYLIKNCSYGHNEYVYDYIEEYFWGYKYEVSAYGMLKGHIGVCDDYSATFAMMMQAIGLDCYVVGGQTSLSGGGYGGHAWCEMVLDGEIYVFDPQVEDNIAKGGKILYYRFGKKYDEVPGKYIK